MALLVAGLQADLEALVASPTADIAVASQAWGDAYFNYAVAAQAGVSLPSALAAVTSKPLVTSFSASMVAKSFFKDLPNTLTSFWLTPPVVFAGVNNGPVTAVPGTTALATSLITIGQANAAKNRSAASLDDLASAIHLFTTSVVVTLLTPTGTPIPSTLL